MTSAEPRQQLELSTLLAGSIHDMKNSLGLILQTVEALEDHVDQPLEQRRQRYRNLHHESLRLNNQMLQLLTLYKLQQDVYDLNVVEYPVADLLEEVALEHAPVLAARGVTLDWDCEPELLAFIDRDLVAGILGNALNNAQRFAREKVQLGGQPYSHPVGQGTMLTVDDDGPGFSSEKLAALQSGDFHAGTAGGDTGLGLLFSSQVAAQHCHHGECGRLVCANDSPLGGARLSLYLP